MNTKAWKPPVPLEREIQRNGIKLLKMLGWTVHRRNTGTFFATYKGKERLIRSGTPGMADTWGVMPDGRRFEIEFKRPGNRPTELQLAWLKSQNNAHCAAFWVFETGHLELYAKLLMNGANVHWLRGDSFMIYSAPL
jgi:hypothetical protein